MYLDKPISTAWYFPRELERCSGVPYGKKRESSSVCNYRPVSLLSWLENVADVYFLSIFTITFMIIILSQFYCLALYNQTFLYNTFC